MAEANRAVDPHAGPVGATMLQRVGHGDEALPFGRRAVKPHYPGDPAHQSLPSAIARSRSAQASHDASSTTERHASADAGRRPARTAEIASRNSSCDRVVSITSSYRAASAYHMETTGKPRSRSSLTLIGLQAAIHSFWSQGIRATSNPAPYAGICAYGLGPRRWTFACDSSSSRGHVASPISTRLTSG